MIRTVAALSLAIAACTPTIPVYAPGLEEGVHVAIDAGLPVYLTDNPAAVIRVTETSRTPPGGHAYHIGLCKRWAEIHPGMPPEITAHEIGHLLGLEHAGPGNLMHTPHELDDFDLSDDQIAVAEYAADWLIYCPGGILDE